MHHYKIVLYVILSVVLITTLVLLRSSKKQKEKIANKTSLELWLGKKRSLEDTATEKKGILTTIEGELPGVSYTMNIEIEKWLHNKDTHFRELLTHGNGSFGFLEINDLLSIAIDAHKNDIIIEVNTKVFDPRTNTGTDKSVESCIAQAEGDDTIVSDPTFKIRIPQRLTLKYFPIAKYFHIAIVLTQNRVDAYMDGKLAVTKVFNGNVVEPNTQVTLPFKWRQGKPIKAYVSNFRYFNTELDVSTVKEIYQMDINPNGNTDLPADDSLQEDSDYQEDNRQLSGCN
tara:strand:- start:1659 stop:2516 length:858 start_codon:yes stop_codon:yes gene_type:complete